MGLSWQRYSKVAAQLAEPAGWGVATAVACWALAVAPSLGLILAALVIVGCWWRGRHVPPGTLAVLRLVIIAAVGAVWLAAGDHGWLPAAAFAVLLLASILDPLVAETTKPVTGATGLPGVGDFDQRRLAGPLSDQTALASLVLVGVALFAGPSWWFSGATVALLAWGAWNSWQRLRASQSRAEVRSVAKALDDLQPRFAVMFVGRPEARYQLRMWLPYLRRLDEPFVVLTRRPDQTRELASDAGVPVVAAAHVAELDQLVPDSVRAIFYVSNENHNANGVRLPRPLHVHLGHGDSEKPSSWAKATGVFDRIFVAGQAGIDRFARHGVLIPASKFVVVGRPNLDDLEQAADTPPDRRVVLYAPTWRGGLDDMRFGSLPVGLAIVRALLALGATVIFRPHPYSARDAESRMLISAIDHELARAGSQHLVSTAASRQSIAECFNASTAAVTDISSVPIDYLATGKPLAVTDMVGLGRDLEEYPFLRACYQLSPGEPLEVVLAQMLGGDPLAAERARVQEYYLGPADPRGADQRFLDACRAVLADREEAAA